MVIFLGFNDFILFYFLQQTHREEPLHQLERQQGHKHTPDLYVLSYFQQKLCFYGCFFFGFCSILPTLNAEICCGTFLCLFFFSSSTRLQTHASLLHPSPHQQHLRARPRVRRASARIRCGLVMDMSRRPWDGLAGRDSLLNLEHGRRIFIYFFTRHGSQVKSNQLMARH